MSQTHSQQEHPLGRFYALVLRVAEHIHPTERAASKAKNGSFEFSR